jgi:2-oxo-4-hydroxy-4-carboxy--5-ureidoimidazoline (OHCU) decarboxylase
MSFREQGYDRETEAAVEALERLNREYEARFGFRYCVFVNGRSRPALVPELEAALGRDPTRERERAVRDVVAIARDRYVKAPTAAPA